jgi:UDP-N-acetylmuramate--alanine ligase
MSSYIYGNSILIDDYAHHPSEIKALYESLRIMYSKYKITCIFQSHTYSRTIRFKKEFKKVLKLFDDVYLLDVFSSAREISDEQMVKKVNRYFKKFKKFNENILNNIKKEKNEVWVFLGAGICNELLEKFKKEHF